MDWIGSAFSSTEGQGERANIGTRTSPRYGGGRGWMVGSEAGGSRMRWGRKLYWGGRMRGLKPEGDWLMRAADGPLVDGAG